LRAGAVHERVAERDRAAPRCQIWGVLNVTPDSFSDGAVYLHPEAALAHARRMLAEGADVIDVGGASSRPAGKLYGAGAGHVAEAEEAARVLPVIAAIRRELVARMRASAARISVDTTRASVARAAIDAGAEVVNDVSCAANPELLDVVAERGVEYVVMHTRGNGEVAGANTDYRDVVAEVVSELLTAVERAERHGIARAKLWIDPGLGFAKTAAQSLALLAHTGDLVALGLPVLCGPSRKGFIAEVAPTAAGERPTPVQREPGTLAAVTLAVLQGARGVRVHDVAANRQALLVAEAARAGASRS
jgi:dihydropteroate synthase